MEPPVQSTIHGRLIISLPVALASRVLHFMPPRSFTMVR